MGETPGRGYLPPTVPAPGPHPRRQQWPPPTVPFSFYPGGGGWGAGTGGPPAGVGKQFLSVPPPPSSSSPPQSEGMDLTSTRGVVPPPAAAEQLNGAPGGPLPPPPAPGELNGGTTVSVIASNPLLVEDKPPPPTIPPLPSSELFLPSKVFSAVTGTAEDGGGGHSEGGSSPASAANSRANSRASAPAAAPISRPSQQPPPPPVSSLLPLVSSSEVVVPSPRLPSAPAVPAPLLPPSQEDKSLVHPDHVESLLENMFQGETKPSVIVSNCSRPVLTEDRVVEILQDRDTSITEVKTEDSSQPAEAEPPSLEEKKEEVVKQEKVAKEEPIESQFMEVESELEKMFAGIEEEEKPSSVEGGTTTGPAGSVRKPKKRPSKPRKRKSSDSQQQRKASSGGKSKQKTKQQRAGEKDTSNDSLSRSVRGPYVHVEGSKESPAYVSVVNSGGREEEERERGDKRKHHTVLEGRVRGSNLYNSTLSSKYNSQNIDHSWVCVFCKLRAHSEGGLGGEPAGDLFGPYVLTVPKPELVPSDRELSAEQKRRGGGKAAVSLRAVGGVEAFIHNFAKKSKKSSGSSVTEEEVSGEREIWSHEKCAVWAPGVYFAGLHLVGLAEAVSTAALTKCTVCGNTGACIGCVRRNCSGRVHYGCGRSAGWHLSEEDFISICPLHAVKKENPKKAAT